MNELKWLAPFLFCLVLVAASPSGQASRPRPDRPAVFVDVTAKAKIDFVHKSGASPEKYMVETFGSGVAWIDYDNDGFQDLYFVNGAPGAADALYHNHKDGTFRDVTAQAGVDGSGAGKTAYKTGVAVGDYDNNGYLDLFVTSFGPDVLYKNNGDGTFTDVTAKAGVAGGPAEWSTSTGFLDFDRDGDLDLYVTNYLDFRLNDNPYLRAPQGRIPHVLPSDDVRWDGGSVVQEQWQRHVHRRVASGRNCQSGREGSGSHVLRFRPRRRPDIYIANDMVRNFLYRNSGNGTFVDVAYAAGVGFDSNGKPQAGMGVDCADVDGNGFPDIFVTNFSEELNTLYSNLGEGLFEDITMKAGLGAGFIPLGFGTKMFDFDNDGDLDIHVTNGHVIDNVTLYQPNLSYAQKDLLFENVGGRFRDVSAQAGPALQAERVGRGLAVADFDNDGNVDVVISSAGRPPVLLKNQGAGGGNWITIRAQGGKSNSFGLGATVRVQTSNGLQVREINNVASYLSANDIRLHVGLGTAKIVQQIDLLWPSGTKQTLKDVAVNQILVIKEP